MKLQSKILLIALPLTLALAALTAVLGRRATEGLMVRELGQRLRPQVENFAAGMAGDWSTRRESALLARLQRAQAFSGAAFVEALSPEGIVQAHTNVLETGKRRGGSDDLLALSSDATVFARSRGARGPLLVIAAPVWRADEEFLLSGGPRARLGTLRVGLPLEETLASARRVGAVVAAMAAGVCLVSLALTLAFLRLGLLRPVLAIEAATARVAAGDYDVEVPVLSGDELGALSSAFNRMSAALSRTVVSRDRLEEALTVSRATLEASADGMLVVDRKLKSVTYNRRFVEMWGLSEEVVRTGDVRLMAESVAHLTEDPERFLRLATASGAGADETERRSLIQLKDGRVFDRIARPYSLRGTLMGRTVTTRDVTLHFAGLRALAQARDEALEAARLKSTFLANVSHEVRTPLNAVIGSAEMLLGTDLDESQQELTENLSRAARALLELVDGVLDFSKIEAGRMTVERTSLFPGDLLSEAAALLGPRAAEKSLSLTTDAGEAASLELLGDPTRLRQVLLNLLSNAVKFTARGAVAASISVLSSDAKSAELEFSVRDTGIGIPPSEAARLFTPFTQGDDSTTRRFGGTGLGLAISRSLVELMGGTMGFENVPGGGSLFWFRLRLDRAEGAAAGGAHGGSAPAAAAGPRPKARPAAPRAPAPARDRLRVLIVDDNRINRLLLQRQLERLGCPFVAVDGGVPAVEAARTMDFGLILLDCQMPDLDGYAVAAKIRELESGRRHTPIVAITANTTEADRRRCAEAGMDDFMPKPLTLASLASTIERWDRSFDEAALQAFAAVAADDPNALAGALADFLADAIERLSNARAALARGDLDACGRSAHAVRGAAASVGARGLAELCRRLEETAQAGVASPELSSLLDQADAEAARLIEDASARRRN